MDLSSDVVEFPLRGPKEAEIIHLQKLNANEFYVKIDFFPVYLSGLDECSGPIRIKSFVEEMTKLESQMHGFCNSAVAGKPKILSNTAENIFKKATECWLSEQPL